MTKLREIKERKQGGTHDVDLRGLGNDPLLREAFPYANLFVAGVDAAALDAVAAAFQLSCHPSQHQHGVHLRKKVLHSGEHKGQAVALFGAALMIHQQHPQAAMQLMEVSGLHIHLTAAIKNQPVLQNHDADDLVDLSHKGPLMLAVPVQLHLAQSGVAIDVGAAPTSLASGQMQQHLDAIRQLAAPAAQAEASNLKRAG